MCLDDSRLLVGRRFLLGLAKFFNEAHRTAFKAPLEPTASTSMNQLYVTLDCMEATLVANDILQQTRTKATVNGRERMV